MNISKLAIEYSALEEPKAVDKTPLLRTREGELVRIIEAARRVVSTEEWGTLKKLIFDKLVENLERNLREEATKDNPSVAALAKINGQLIWARKYADLSKLADVYRLELTNVKKTLHEKEE